MRLSSCTLAALLPLLSMVTAFDPPSNPCQEAQGIDGAMRFHVPALEVPRTVIPDARNGYETFLSRKLDNHMVDFTILVSPSNQASIQIVNGHGKNRHYRVFFTKLDPGNVVPVTIASYLVWSNSPQCQSASEVDWSKVAGVYIEMERR
jgi:hypothetical protein